MWTRIAELFHRWPGWVLVGVVLAVVIGLLVARLALPHEIRIATAIKGGLYYDLAEKLAPSLAERSGHSVQVLETRGTVDNVALLRSGEAHLAILQAGAAETDGLVAIAPLYPDVVHIIVRKDCGVTDPTQLDGHCVALGPEGSGMRQSAQTILQHFRVDCDSLRLNDHYFGEMLDDPTIEAAVVTTGMLNPDLNRLLETGEFDLLPVHDVDAIAMRNPFFTGITIPRGMYSEKPLVPPQPVPTVATTALLATTARQKPALVRAALQAVYEDYPSRGTPTLIPLEQAADWLPIPLHKTAYAYYRPLEGFSLVANMVQSVAAVKELLAALGAGLYLLWLRWRAHKRRRHEQRVKEEYAKLDALLMETVEIERAQIGMHDANKLADYLDDVTRLKLSALEQLSLQDIRGDVRFSIFLTQCANLIRKIQGKLNLLK